jgi:hypothetical protein
MKPSFVFRLRQVIAVSSVHLCSAGILAGFLLFLCVSAPAQSKPLYPQSEIIGTW